MRLDPPNHHGRSLDEPAVESGPVESEQVLFWIQESAHMIHKLKESDFRLVKEGRVVGYAAGAALWVLAVEDDTGQWVR